jgi:hypothetical protein
LSQTTAAFPSLAPLLSSESFALGPYFPYGFGGGAMPRRLFGAFGVATDLGFGFGPGATGVGVDCGVEGGSSKGSPMEIVAGTGAGSVGTT